MSEARQNPRQTELSLSLFRNDREAVFVERPNRFLIIAGDRRDGEDNRKEGGGSEDNSGDGKAGIPCHCPNPGRLIEFFGYRGSDIPGARLILEKREPGSGARTRWTAAAVYHQGGVVPLFSARANRAAEKLVLGEIIPGLREIQPEFTLGNSRFDFLCVDRRGNRHLVEVKACSLVEHGVAMFPDAPSERALKHLKELAAARDYNCHILFAILHGEPEVFIPNLHTDPQFAAALMACGEKDVHIHACLLRSDPEGKTRLVQARVPVDLSHGKLAEADSGSYLIMLRLPQARTIETGALGPLRYEAGWYIYAGSARKNLSHRVKRHLRRVRKKRHWHIDYLSPFAEQIDAYPIYSYRNLECRLAGALKNLGGRGIPRFGSSDCPCESHLFYFPEAPLKNPAFLELLLRFRHQEALKPQ
jgi:sugar fermentation stimulation protein A